MKKQNYQIYALIILVDGVYLYAHDASVFFGVVAGILALFDCVRGIDCDCACYENETAAVKRLPAVSFERGDRFLSLHDHV